MADDSRWRPGKPLRIIPIGDVATASEWIPFARRKMVELSRFGDYARRTWVPVPGVTIRGEMLSGIPRVFIETGRLVFTAGFETNADGVLECVVKMAPDYQGAFSTALTITPEVGAPALSSSSVGDFVNLGDGQGFFVMGSTGLSVGYVVTNSAAVTVHPIVAFSNVDFEDVRQIAYLGKFAQGKRLMNIPYTSSNVQLPRITLFTEKSLALANFEFPLPAPYVYGDVDVRILRPVVCMGTGNAVMMVQIGAGSLIDFRRAATADGGFTWTYLPKGVLEDLLDTVALGPAQATPSTFKMAPLPGGRAIVTGFGNPNYPSPGSSAVIAFLSADKGITFTGPYFVRALGVAQLLFEAISLGGDQVGMLTVDAAGDVCLSRSDDGGQTWTELPPIAPGIATLLGGVRTVGNVVLLTTEVLGIGVYNGSDTTHHLYLSSDMGVSWVKGPRLDTAPPTAAVPRDFYYALRIGSTSNPLPANPAIPELYDLWPPAP